MTFVVILAAVVLAVAAPAEADVRLGGPLVALSAGPRSAYAVVGSGRGDRPFRLVRSSGKGATLVRAFGSPGARFADVAGGEVVFGRPTRDGFAYVDAAGAVLGEGTGPPQLTGDGVVYPDEDGDVVVGATRLTSTGPVLRHTPVDAIAGPLVLDLAQSKARSELRVIGPQAPAEPLSSMRGLHDIPATITRDKEGIYVAYRIGNRVTIATARPNGRWSRRRLHTRGAFNGAPAIARVGLRTFVATSRRRSIYLTASGPAGTFTDRLTRPHGSDLAPLAAAGPDDHLYIAWTRHAHGSARRVAVLRRLL